MIGEKQKEQIFGAVNVLTGASLIGIPIVSGILAFSLPIPFISSVGMLFGLVMLYQGYSLLKKHKKALMG